MLRSRLALVTGSTSGIGLGIARSLAAQGADLVINGFGPEHEISALCAKLAADYKVKVRFEGANLRNPDEIEAMMNNLSREGGVDILVNNAGIQHVSPIDAFPVSKYDDIIAINMNAVFHTMRLALPHMKAQNWGRIINIAS